MIDLFSYPEMVLLSNVTEVKIKNCICKLTNNYLLCYSLIKLILIQVCTQLLSCKSINMIGLLTGKGYENTSFEIGHLS